MKILVIEDDLLTLEFLSSKLREHGYAVDTAKEGEDGLFKARNCDYDAVVLDVVLPGMSGWDLLSRLRKFKRTPVLMLTSCSSTDDQVRGLDMGADDYVKKPFDVAALLARLRALIRRSAQHAQARIDIAGISIDLTARTVASNGKPVALTPREYAIVEHLALHRGKIVSRSSLFDHLFDENDDSLSNIIDVHVGKIRKKLGRDFIVTRHGHGYVIPCGETEQKNIT